MNEIKVNCSLAKLMFYGYNHLPYEFKINGNPCKVFIKKVFTEKLSSRLYLNENICFIAKIKRFKSESGSTGKIVEIKFNAFSNKGSMTIKENEPEE